MVLARQLSFLLHLQFWAQRTKAAFMDGPRVSNPSWNLGCTAHFETLAAAEAYCDLTTCHALHDYDCDGEKWRACPNATLEQLQNAGDGTRACTMVPVPEETPSYVPGPRVDNQAFAGLCSTVYYETDAAAQVACDADSACGAIHDYDCNGNGWRVCGTVAALMAAGPGTLACTEVKSAAVAPVPPAAYVEGPRVDNTAHEGNCGPFFNTAPEAQAACDADPSCEALHDYACNGQGWRVCGTITALEEAGPGTDACTQVPTATGTPNATEYINGPRVANAAYVDLCSTAFYDDITVAQALCTADPFCKAIHDFDCNDDGWRVCGTLQALQDAGPGSQACTQVQTDASSPVGYTQGPRVSNMAWPSLCGAATYTLDDAVAACDADPSCAALHDFDCDGSLWRVCHTTVEVLIAVGEGSEACTQIPAAGAGYDEGPRVSNEAWPEVCSEEHYTLEDAQSLCNAEPGCQGLHDYDCNGVGWRHCTSVNALLLAGASDTKACTLVKIGDPSFTAGPRVDNAAWRLGCSTETYDEAAAEEMCANHANCTAIHDFNCDGRLWRVCYDTTIDKMMHDGGRGTKACTKLKPDYCACMASWTYNREVYTGCSTTPDSHLWDFDFWCYIVGGSECPDATPSTISADLHWRVCTDPCLCEGRWTWEGETYSGCAETPDFTFSWCYVEGGTTCNSATESTASPGRAWHECQGSTTTTTGIASFFMEGPRVPDDAWLGNCGTTLYSLVDALEACYQDDDCHAVHDWGCNDEHWRVCHGIEALAAFGNGTGACTKVIIPDTTTTVATTTNILDFFTEGPRVGNSAWTVGCTSTWFPEKRLAMEYCLSHAECHGLHDYNCEDAAWRTCDDIHEVLDAQEGTEACTMVRQPPCTCASSWTWEGLEYSGCTTTPDYHAAWCYVIGGHECANATQTEGSALFWIECPDPCACMDSWEWQGTNFTGCNRTYDDPTLNWCFVDGGLECEAATPSTVYEDMAWSTCVTTTTTVSTTHPSGSFVDGLPVGNAAWRGVCSTTHYNLSTAQQICVETPNCHALHDYACDAKKWRVCTASVSEMAARSDGDIDACTKERTTTLTTTGFGPVVLTDNFVEGPLVGNSIWIPAGCDAFERQYDVAKQACVDRENCTALHDFNCDGLGWRLCGSIESLMQQETIDRSACTMMYNDVCSCVGEWYWLGHNYSGCAETPDWLGHSWCYAVGGDLCDRGVESTVFPSWYWLECNPPCACRESWDWEGETYHGCSNVEPDGHWCYVSGGHLCQNATPSTVSAGEFYRYCEATTTTMTSTTHTGIARNYVTGPRVADTAWTMYCDEDVEWTVIALEKCMYDLSCSVLHDWGCDGQHWRACRNATIEDVVSFQPPRENYDSCTMVLKEPCACNATTPSMEPGEEAWCYVLGGRACESATPSTDFDTYAWRHY